MAHERFEDVMNVKTVPWQVTLSNYLGLNFCTGVILDHSTVLTASTCYTKSKDKSQISVTTGQSIQVDSQRVEVIEIVLKDDLAVLKLKHPLYISDHVQPICLARSSQKRSTTFNCFYTNWGNWTNSYFHQHEQSNSDIGGLHICLENNVPVLTGIASIVQNEYGRRSTNYVNVLQNRDWIESQMVKIIQSYQNFCTFSFYCFRKLM